VPEIVGKDEALAVIAGENQVEAGALEIRCKEKFGVGNDDAPSFAPCGAMVLTAQWDSEGVMSVAKYPHNINGIEPISSPPVRVHSLLIFYRRA